MNSPTFFNKVEITLYSSLTSILSGINRLIAHDQPVTREIERADSHLSYDSASIEVGVPERSASFRWESIQQALLTLLFWVILGLAAGFLIGMIKGL